MSTMTLSITCAFPMITFWTSVLIACPIAPVAANTSSFLLDQRASCAFLAKTASCAPEPGACIPFAGSVSLIFFTPFVSYFFPIGEWFASTCATLAACTSGFGYKPIPRDGDHQSSPEPQVVASLPSHLESNHGGFKPW